MKNIKILLVVIVLASAFIPASQSDSMAAATVNKVRGITDTYVFVACSPSSAYQVIGVVDIKEKDCNELLNKMVIETNKQYPTANGVIYKSGKAIAILIK